MSKKDIIPAGTTIKLPNTVMARLIATYVIDTNVFFDPSCFKDVF